jgi:hypothetical protein
MTDYLPSGEPEILQNFINGEFVAPAGGKYLDNVAPAVGKVTLLIHPPL